MTPKDKAQFLVQKYFDITMNLNLVDGGKQRAKYAAIIAVDEIIAAIDFDWMEIQNLDRQHNYWDDVKIEIINL